MSKIVSSKASGKTVIAKVASKQATTVPSKVTIEIYTTHGVCVRVFQNNMEAAGTHEVLWDGKNNQGAILSGGVYFYVVKTALGQSTGKLTLLSGKN